MGHYSFTQT